MKVLAVTNLYPRPDEPRRGMYNAQLFAALAKALAADATVSGRRRLSSVVRPPVRVLCLVPDWRVWRWAKIRAWESPVAEDGRPTTDDGQQTAAGDAGMTVAYVPVFYLPVIGRGLSWWTYGWGLRRHTQCFREADAVIATWLYPDAVAAAGLAKKSGKPLWIKVHGSDRFHLKAFGRRGRALAACRYAAGILPNSQFLADKLQRAGVRAGKIHVVRHGVDAELFHPRSRQDAISLLGDAVPPDLLSRISNPESRIALCVGNLLPIKGQDMLLDAWTQLVAGYDKSGAAPAALSLVIVGAGPMREDLEERAIRSGVSDSVFFLGSRAHADVALWMNLADCLCLPSRSEGMPNVVLEALASGLPVVSTDVGDVPRYIRDGENGFYVKRRRRDLRFRFSRVLEKALKRDWNREDVAASSGGVTWQDAAERVLALVTDRM